jgi:hypothetical protein
MPGKKKEAAAAPGQAHDQAADNGAGQAAQRPPDKAGAVREALAAGVRSRQDIIAHVRNQYGMEISPNYVSRVTSKARKGKASQKRTPAARPAAKAPARDGGGLTPQDLVALADLAERAGGVEMLRDLLDALKRVR